MKKLINKPEDVVRENLEGMAAAHSDIIKVHFEPNFVYRADAPVRNKVALISGGGSGHEPMHAGFVGSGMLDAACPGEVFTSPTPDQMLEAAKTVHGGAGVLNIVKNYSGDVMNFEMAAELAPRPRKIYKHEHAQLFMAVSEDGGRTFGVNYPISGMRVCPCCVPNIAFLDGGKTLVVSYRFVTEEYLRDNVVIRSTDGGKTFGEPIYISEDGWVANFCPHAGTSMIADDSGTLHSLWFTVGRGDEEAGIYYTHSEDGGVTFAPRQRVAKTPAHTVLHTQIIVDDDNRLWATWENILDENPQIFLARRAADEPTWSQVYQVSDGGKIAMLPTLAADSGRVYVAWTELRGESSEVKLRTGSMAYIKE